MVPFWKAASTSSPRLCKASGFRVPGQCAFIVACRHLNDQVHLAAFGLKPRQVLRSATHVHVVERVDPEAVRPVHHLADFILRVPVGHCLAVIAVVMGKSIERIHTQNQAADLNAAEVHFRYLNLRSAARYGQSLGRCGLGRRQWPGGRLRSKPGCRTAH